MSEAGPVGVFGERENGGVELVPGSLPLLGPPRGAGALALERDRLVAAARSFAEASLSDGTRRVYRSSMEDFALWCHDHEAVALPALPETICLYLSDLALLGLSVSTMQLRLAALKLAYRTAGREQPGWPASPTEDVGV